MVVGVPDHIHNERTKLSANALNTAATSSFTVGVLAPIAASLYTSGASFSTMTIGLAAVVWISAAAILHFLARRGLGALRP